MAVLLYNRLLNIRPYGPARTSERTSILKPFCGTFMYTTCPAMLTSDELAAYLNPLPLGQVAGIQGVRRMIQELAPDLVEQIDDGKWFRGLLTYHTPDGIFAYALGPRA